MSSVRFEQRDRLGPRRSTVTSTNPLLTLGGGVDFVVWRGLAVGVDVRQERIFDADATRRFQIPQDLTLTRLGSSVSYRF